MSWFGRRGRPRRRKAVVLGFSFTRGRRKKKPEKVKQLRVVSQKYNWGTIEHPADARKIVVQGLSSGDRDAFLRVLGYPLYLFVVPHAGSWIVTATPFVNEFFAQHPKMVNEPVSSIEEGVTRAKEIQTARVAELRLRR